MTVVWVLAVKFGADPAYEYLLKGPTDINALEHSLEGSTENPQVIHIGGPKWSHARRRTTHEGNLTLPSLGHLPVKFPADSDQFSQANIFVTQTNYVKMLKHFSDSQDDKGESNGESEKINKHFLKFKRSFPVNNDFLSTIDFSSCAVVGNSGVLLNSSFGEAIDSHSVVFRINQAVIKRTFRKHVGAKTTFRLINTR